MPRLIIVTSAKDVNDIPSKEELLKFTIRYILVQKIWKK